MLKKGFTLAEVLITLGVIGVVAAITLPSLLADTASAQIGPKLAKSVSMLEQANESLLSDNSSDTLLDTGYFSGNNAAKDYTKELRKYLKGSDKSGSYLAKDGVLYTFTKDDTDPTNTDDPPHMQKIGTVVIDINGSTDPNTYATDKFKFSFWNDGSLRPKGGTDWNGAASSADSGTEHWKKKCKKDDVVSGDNAEYCAGHIFENSLKVYYR